MIEDYKFGLIVIDGKEYKSDMLIFPDGRIQDSWWRASGHRLTLNDIRELVDSGPEIIIAGTGASGILKPEQNLEKELAEKKIRFISAPTAKAVKIYNDFRKKKKTGACLHLTC